MKIGHPSEVPKRASPVKRDQTPQVPPDPKRGTVSVSSPKRIGKTAPARSFLGKSESVGPLVYPVQLTPDKKDGGYIVTCRDLPEAITQGDTLEEALVEAADALEEAVAARIDDGRDIPVPSEAKPGEHYVAVSSEFSRFTQNSFRRERSS